MRNIPNLRHLRAFREVARARSISRAASRVFLSQPAITQAIAKLEGLLGCALFDRHSDGMFPTDAGDALLSRVERALDCLASGVRDVLRNGSDAGGRNGKAVENLITTTHLRALIAVSDAHNFSIAARSIGVSQPSLHRTARDLERLLEVDLFDKTGQGITLTRPARRLSRQAKLAFAELLQGFDEIEALIGRETGRIRIGTMPLPRTYLLPNAINGFLAERPGVRVSVVDGPYVDLLAGLRCGDLDMLVGALRSPVPVDDIMQEALFDDRLAVVARVGHPLCARPRIDCADLASSSWVAPREGTPTRERFDALFAPGAPGDIIESSSLILIRGILMGSDRLTLISAHQVLEECNHGLLCVLPVVLHDPARRIGVTVRRDWQPTAGQALFLEHLRRVARALPSCPDARVSDSKNE